MKYKMAWLKKFDYLFNLDNFGYIWILLLKFNNSLIAWTRDCDLVDISAKTFKGVLLDAGSGKNIWICAHTYFTVSVKKQTHKLTYLKPKILILYFNKKKLFSIIQNC